MMKYCKEQKAELFQGYCCVLSLAIEFDVIQIEIIFFRIETFAMPLDDSLDENWIQWNGLNYPAISRIFMYWKDNLYFVFMPLTMNWKKWDIGVFERKKP